MSTNVDDAAQEAPSATRGIISAVAGWLGLVLLVATVAYWAITGQFDVPGRILLIAAFLALTAYVWLNPEQIAGMITGRGTRNILSTVLMVVLAIALVVGINWLYGLLASRLTGEFGRIDVTAGQSLTLSEQSIKAVKQVPAGTQAVGLFRSDSAGVSARQTAENLLKEYTKYNPNLTVQWIDIDVNLSAIQRYGVSTPNVLVFDTGEKFQIASDLTETGFTGALLKLLDSTQKTVAFLNTPSLLSFTGSAGQDAMAATLARSGLTNENYTVLPAINLVVSTTISVNDVTVLIVPPSPTTDPLPDTATRLILDYLDHGGHVLLIGDPLAAPLPTAILSKYGLKETRTIAVEQDQNSTWSSSPLNLLVFDYPSSTITQDMAGKPTLFRAAGVIQPPTSTITGFIVSNLIQTTAQGIPAVLSTDASGQSSLQPAPDAQPGALTIAVTVEQQAPDASTTLTGTNKPDIARMVVVDDMDFASDDLMGQTGAANRDMFNNIVNWLSQSEERISVRPQDTTSRQMLLSTEQKNFIAWTTIIFLPLLALVGGGVVWWRRR